MEKEFWVVGAPLVDRDPFSPEAVQVLHKSDLIIAESKRIFELRWKQTKLSFPETLLYLDPARIPENRYWEQALKRTPSELQRVALVSDTGMPMLFDPGREWMTLALRTGYRLRCVGNATSWGTALALSGWEPPFTVYGFLPRKKEDRATILKQLARNPFACMIMDTPYRFISTIEDCILHFPKKSQGFLAWNIAHPNEHYLWASLTELHQWAKQPEHAKGEFVLIVKPA